MNLSNPLQWCRLKNTEQAQEGPGTSASITESKCYWSARSCLAVRTSEKLLKTEEDSKGNLKL